MSHSALPLCSSKCLEMGEENGLVAGRAPVICSFRRLQYLINEGSSPWWSLLFLTKYFWLSSYQPHAGRLLPLCCTLRVSIACDSLWPVKCAALLERGLQSWSTIWHILFSLSQRSLCQPGLLSANTGQKPLPANPSWIQSLSTR